MLTGHTAAVTCLALSRDGRLLLSGSEDHTLRLWELETGTQLRHWTAHEDGVQCAALSPDGRLAVSGGVWGPAILWDTGTGTELRRLAGQQQGCLAAVFSPEGRLVATGCGDHTVRCWDPATGQELRRLTGHTADVTAVAFSPDRRQLLSGCAQYDPGADQVRLWDLDGGTELRRFGEELFAVTAVGFAVHGALLVATTMDGLLHVWDPVTGAQTGRFEVGTGNLRCLAVAPDGRRLLTGSGTDHYDADLLATLGVDNRVRLVDPGDGRELARYEGHTGNVNALAFIPDGRRALSASADRTIRLWEL
ncbi:WD40 repeat domain-containing protein [Kitasatospora cathayae]|uniref:WD40 repeat domain-containing protein n=1 Tax=Kitasatospora cathayae TaxID=3004092 RepID=A0ABY7QE60_9ACTN|nr:WD40 repeat domain-containing protein [Kitasatospora sp. HUAS 3-15]WBP91037.1 WD40 repeat domain-containing protein [Kitasatospora sp. HUAS 3-15]